MDATLLDLASKIGKAKAASDVVGADDEGRAKRVLKIRKALHPDNYYTQPDRDSATLAFARLEQLLNQESRYVSSSFDITTKTRTYTVNGLEFEGQVANLYATTYARGGEVKHGLVKMSRTPADNDLLVQEAKVLKAVFKEPHKRNMFYPRIEDTFVHRDDKTNVDRRTNVLRRFDGFVSLEEIMRSFLAARMFIHPRDTAWMLRRALAGVSLAHELGYVHGSLTPGHILIHPELHGLQIVGWGNSVESGDTIKLLGDPLKTYYAPEVLLKEPATTATDLYTISRTFMYTMDPHESGSRPIRAFFKGVTYDNPSARPQDARELLGEFDELLERVWGERTFHNMVIPTKGS